MASCVSVVGAGLAGSEAALQLAASGFEVKLYEMRPSVSTPVHKSALCAELVCSNSLKSMKPDSAAGMLKQELRMLGSRLYACALQTAVPAGGALAVDRWRFAEEVSRLIEESENISVIRKEAASVAQLCADSDAVVLASGPLTSDALASDIMRYTGDDYLAFFDAAAPIVMADSLDLSILFSQNRYEDIVDSAGDYLNAPFEREEYDAFIEELLSAERVIQKDFETKDLFNACQPIEEIARSGHDAPRFGPLKPVGLTSPLTGRRPWAAVQLRAEDAHAESYNLVGFQTNLTFPEQKRIFRMIPGLQNVEFARYGVMHRNTFINAPALLDESLRLRTSEADTLAAPVFVAGQLAGTEGYCEAIRSGVHAALSVMACLRGISAPVLPAQTVFGSLLCYATDSQTKDYQPMHVNFGIMEPLDKPIRNKRDRYAAYAKRGEEALLSYRLALQEAGILPETLVSGFYGGEAAVE